MNISQKELDKWLSTYSIRLKAVFRDNVSKRSIENLVRHISDEYEYSGWYITGGEGFLCLVYSIVLDSYEIWKFPNEKILESQTKINRFFRGFIIQRKLHQKIGFGVPGMYFAKLCPSMVSMEAINGKSLVNYIQEQSTKNNIKMFCLICVLMTKIHTCQVIHRDIKPENILVAEDESCSDSTMVRLKPVIVDYGLAKRIDGQDDNLTGIGAEMGSFFYSPPEQVGHAADAADADYLNDVFSLTVLLYTILVIKEKPVPRNTKDISQLDPENDLPPEYLPIFKAGTAARERRYQNVPQLLRAVMKASGFSSNEDWLEKGVIETRKHSDVGAVMSQEKRDSFYGLESDEEHISDEEDEEIESQIKSALTYNGLEKKMRYSMPLSELLEGMEESKKKFITGMVSTVRVVDQMGANHYD